MLLEVLLINGCMSHGLRSPHAANPSQQSNGKSVHRHVVQKHVRMGFGLLRKMFQVIPRTAACIMQSLPEPPKISLELCRVPP
eukprot:2356377-Amphidinium_carterae.1